MNVFEDFGLSQQLLTTIKNQGITNPTQIQGLTVPHIIEGRDVVGESATGSGKTLAFGCGVVEQVKPNEGLQALILTPTRELAEQVKDSLGLLASEKRLHVSSIYGGVPFDRQIYDLARVEVIVATPGRLLDHLQRGNVNLKKIKMLILDEADRMLDMGFIDDIERIIGSCPKKRQTLFFSATISSRIKGLAQRYMLNPALVSATRFVDPAKLKQGYYDVDKNLKLSLLVHLLQEEQNELGMVFCNTRNTVEFVVKNLKANQVKVFEIHGGMAQNKRGNTIKAFNNAKSGVLVCTDVAARGLHIENVARVYNYDIPKDPNDYIHRIGRTARAGAEGKVVNLLSRPDYDLFSRLTREHNNLSIKRIEIPRLRRVKTIGMSFNNKPRRRFSHQRNYRR